MIRKFFSAVRYPLVVITCFLAVSAWSFAVAADCEAIKCDENGEDAEYISCVSEKKTCLEGKIKEVQAQKNTLQSTISVINSKIVVQQLQINQIQAEVNLLEKQITDLDERIEGLNLSLDKLTTMLVTRVREQYKQSRTSPLAVLVSADSFKDFYTTMQYLHESSDQTAQAMQRAELKRILYDQEKQLKEEKQAEVESKRRQLQQEKNVLAQQQNEQKQLLTVTNNNETRYQQLLAEAQAQIASFKSFVSVSGGGMIDADGLGTGSDGSYFSQRDRRWAELRIGSSSENIFNVGCLLTSVAMVLKSQGVDTNPGAIGSNYSYFLPRTAYMLTRSGMSLPGGKTGRKIPVSSIDSELDSGKAVIVGLYAGPYGTHFVVLKKKDGSDYIMFDPYYGPDIKFTSRYSKGSIYSAEIIS